jgi:undecaprenyl-diphosphatase
LLTKAAESDRLAALDTVSPHDSAGRPTGAFVGTHMNTSESHARPAHDPSPRPPSVWFYVLTVVALVLLGLAVERLGVSERVDEPNDLDVFVHGWVVHHRPSWPAVTALLHGATRFGNPNVATLATALVTFTLYGLYRAGVAVVRRSDALVWLAAILGGRLLSLALKEAFGRDRPPVLHRLVTETSYSFPSGHSVFAAVYFAMLASVVARMIPPRLAWLRWACVAVCLTLAVLVAVSRVWLGVHYPPDVIGGLLLGFGWVLTVAALRRGWSHWRGRGGVTPA